MSREVFRVLPRLAGGGEHLLLNIAPSSLSSEEIALDEEAPNIFSLGGRLPISGSPDMAVLGEALHRFLATDDAGWELERRIGLAGDIMRRWSVTAVQAKSFVETADRLHVFLEESYPGHRAYREYSVRGRVGLQRISGRIDLLVETEDGYVIVDHKSFPGRYERWAGKAWAYRPQLQAYGNLVTNATSREILTLLVHMPIVGKIVDVT